MRTHPILMLSALTFAGVLASPAAGQWPSYIAPGIPRLPDGKPNLSAPAPRTSDGKPDLSGLWHIDGPGHINGFGGTSRRISRQTTLHPGHDLSFESGC